MEEAGMEFLLDAVDRFPISEGFADNLEHPDPVPLLFMLQTGDGNPEAADSAGGSGMAQKVGEDGSTGLRVGARRGRDASPTRSAQSTDMVNPEAAGWTKRIRLGSAPPDRAPCPSRMSALKLSIRKYAD